MSNFQLQDGALDEGQLAAELVHAGAGALVGFAGRVRNHHEGRPVLALDYEALDALCRKEGARVLDEALQRFPVMAVRCVHGLGHMEPGDCAVWVGVLAVHRREAFTAASWIIDEVKRRLPIWKCEHYADGTRQWVNCLACAHGTEDSHV
jgi:molybdopterin synthase catalytic subunit